MRALTQNPLVLPVYLPTFILSFGQGILLPILPVFAKSFGVSYAWIGWALAGESIGTLVGDLPAGLLMRKMGRKTVMVAGVTLVSLSVLALFFSQSIYQVVLYRFLAGFGNALWNISRLAYLADATQSHQRGRAIALYGGTSRIGSFLGPGIGGALAGYFTLKTPFLFYAGLAGIGIITSILFVENTSSGSHTIRKTARGHLFAVIKAQYWPLLTAGSGQLCAQTVRTGRNIILPLYGPDILGLDIQTIGWIMSAASFVDMSLFYPAGLIMDRLGRKYVSVPSFTIQAIGVGLIPFTEGFLGLLLAALLIGLGNGLSSGAMMTLGADLAPKDATGEFLAAWRLVGDGGRMGAPVAVGQIADILGLTPATLVIASFGVLASTIFALLVPETLQKSPS